MPALFVVLPQHSRLLCDLPTEYFFTDVAEQPLVICDLNNSADCLLSIQSLVSVCI